MYQPAHLLTIQADSQIVLELVVSAFKEARLQVVQSFDLQLAKSSHQECTCPHHGSDLCDCQMIMLLIYNREDKPVTLVIHGQDGKSHLGVITDPEQRVSSDIERVIQNAVASNQFRPRGQYLWSDAT